jgi:lipopolysaccharide/colanic/teichoic acid biosynthesis glycosyltransferase
MFLERDAFPRERNLRLDDPHSVNGQAIGPTRGGRYISYRTLTETVLTLLLLLPAVPVIVIAALVVKITSRGPIFYLQRRVGRKGQIYTLYKIRTMFHDCERFTGPRWATAGDPRITPVGRWLRRFHVDELPQLGNVLRGEMSLVGPRPERPEITEHLERLIPGYVERLVVRPGLTGLAQVQLPPDCDLASVRTKLAYDLYYVQNLSSSLDLRILLCTACLLLGIPFAFSNRFLKLPNGTLVERAYQGVLANGKVDLTMQVS